MTLVVVQQKGSVIAAISDTGILEHSKQFRARRHDAGS